jgi:undecaprenyl diphosphate synthase
LLHVAIIMDGNGRWANRQGLPRAFGHRAGAQRVEECVRAAPSIGISSMTLYAFSTENWKRPKYEITAIFRLFRVFFRRKAEELKSENVRVRFIGRRDNLSQQVLETVNWVENLTTDCTRLQLNIAIDYGGRNELIRIIEKVVADSAAVRLAHLLMNRRLQHVLIYP